ncbi:MAG: hypothetical protein JWN86_743 [Planctomycetota bacterium]|nr:hypothetical protein [Planctomycetota bacterium]
MADLSRKPEFWVDELWEKHECGGYGRHSEPHSVALTLQGRPVTLISPFPLDPARIESLTLSESGDLLHILAREPRPEEDPPYAGILIVAHRLEPDRYAVVVWHLLYGWALGRLGLDGGDES